jgi:hypothetical protein
MLQPCTARRYERVLYFFILFFYSMPLLVPVETDTHAYAKSARDTRERVSQRGTFEACSLKALEKGTVPVP